jgi:branched-chain amino acid transport system ATP-binding protein
VPPLLSVEGLTARYGTIEVLYGIDLTVDEGEKVVLLGPNGAGKTTLLRAVSRTVAARGSISFDGQSLMRRDPSGVARLGIGHVPAGRGTFVDLSVLDNLRLGQIGAARRGPASRQADLDLIFDTFPILADFRGRLAGQLSGGQQQMLALGRALLGRPRLLLVDEPSLGLAPLVVRQLFETLAQMQSLWGLALLLAEQNARLSLNLADRAYVLAGGRVVLSDTPGQISAEGLHAAYLGTPVAPAVAQRRASGEVTS